MARAPVAPLVVLLLVAAVLTAAHPVARSATLYADIEFSGNVTLTNATQQASFSFRDVTFQSLDFAPLFTGYFSESAAVSGSGNSHSGSFTADLIVGGLIIEFGKYPLSFALYFDDKTSWTGGQSGSFLTDLVTSSTASGGIGGIAYWKVDEIDTSNNVVNTVDFSSIFTSLSVSSGGSSSFTDSSGYIQYNWVATTYNGATYNFTYLQSEVLGQLSLGASLTPKSTDVVLQISNYPYAASSNYLKLTYLVGYGVFQWQGSATVTSQYIATGTAPNSIYVYSSNQASYQNGQGSASVNYDINADVQGANGVGYTQINAIVSGISNGNTGYAITTVSFNAGASFIAYDPQAGFEAPGGSGTALRASALAIFVAALASFFLGKAL